MKKRDKVIPDMVRGGNTIKMEVLSSDASVVANRPKLYPEKSPYQVYN